MLACIPEPAARASTSASAAPASVPAASASNPPSSGCCHTRSVSCSICSWLLRRSLRSVASSITPWMATCGSWTPLTIRSICSSSLRWPERNGSNGSNGYNGCDGCNGGLTTLSILSSSLTRPSSSSSMSSYPLHPLHPLQLQHALHLLHPSPIRSTPARATSVTYPEQLQRALVLLHQRGALVRAQPRHHA